ncbi:MAG: glycosyltransferase family 4 protein [Lachnospiraceae bacterium]|nr:glycosyltransferase family 4 protein [Lachnospiraceae bacterium]
MEEKKKILHITGYMGDAGIGKAISGMVLNDLENEHIILCLEKTINRNEMEKCINNKICVIESPERKTVKSEIENADIVIIHWWQYPLMCEFLADFPMVECRTILWSHVSGCNYPFLSFDFANKFDYIFFTSPFSYENTIWNDYQLRTIKQKSEIVYGLSDIKIEKVKKEYSNNKIITIIYVGTFTKSKINGCFSEICNAIIENNKNVRFVMLGDDERAGWLKKRISELEINEYFEWKGFVNNVYDELYNADIFLYPLNPFHFGTTENVILEAMAMGLPVIALKQNAEKYIIESEDNGILADDIADIIRWTIRLSEDSDLRERVGKSARKSFKERFSIYDNVKVFRNAINHCLEIKKSQKNFADVIGKSPHEWFISAMLPENKELFLGGEETNTTIKRIPYIFCEKTKSSIYHFMSYYDCDNELKKYEKILDELIKNDDLLSERI